MSSQIALAGSIAGPSVEDAVVAESNTELWAPLVKSTTRSKVLLLTWSHTDLPEHKAPNAATRKDFADMIKDCFRRSQSQAEVASVTVFRELHKNGQPHFHAVVECTDRMYNPGQLANLLWSHHSVRADVKHIRGTHPLTRGLEYGLVPTDDKLVVDAQPFLTDPGVLTNAILDKAAAKKKKIERGTAGNHEVYEYLQENPSVRTYAELCRMVESGGGCHIRKGRVSRFISKNIVQADAIVTALIRRRDAPWVQAEMQTKIGEYLLRFFERCVRCACPPGCRSVQRDIDFLVAHHGAGNVLPFFEWADLVLAGAIVKVGRPRNALVLGCPGSGKSTLADLMRIVIPEERTHAPCLNTSTPFSALESHHLVSLCEDWRFTSKVPVSETLEWMEGRRFSVDVKGKEPRAHAHGPPCMHTTNHLAPVKPWLKVDVEAYEDRCFVSRLMVPIPAHEKHLSMYDRMKTCPFCCCMSLVKRCARVRKECNSFCEKRKLLAIKDQSRPSAGSGAKSPETSAATSTAPKRPRRTL